MDILHLFPQVQKDDLPASEEGRPSKYQGEWRPSLMYNQQLQ